MMDDVEPPTYAFSLPLFNLREAARKRDEAIARVAREKWLTRARRVCVYRARVAGFFTSDDVERWLESAGIARWPEPRILGALFKQIQARKWAEPTDQVRTSEMVSNHGRPKRVWRSLR